MEFSWSSGDALVIGPSARKSGEKFLHLSFLRPSINYDNISIRQLIHEFHNFFLRLRNFDKLNDGTTLNSNDLQGISRHYQSVIRSVCLKLKENAGNAATDDLYTSLKEIELIWSLIDVLLLRSADSLPSQDLVEWSKWNFSEPDELQENILHSLNETGGLNVHENYFNMIYTYLLLGRPEEARVLLLQHPRKSDPVFVKVDELLKKIPTLNDKNEWLLWQNLCRQRLNGKHFIAYPELETVVKILCGDNETFRDLLAHLNMKWYQIFVGKLYFSTPFVKIYELSDIAADCLKWQSLNHNVTTAVDDILMAVLDLDLIKMLKLSSEYFHNAWFVAHLADLLYFAGSIELVSMKETVDLRERLLLDYANSLTTHQSLWQLSVDYFLSCPTFGKHCLKLGLERLSCDNVSGRKILKILDICRKYEFFDVARSIAKEQCIKALKENDLNKSLSWCLQTKDSGLASYLVQKFLQVHGRSGLLHSLYLLDNLGEAALLCPSLTFLGKYREFCNLRKAENFKEAASLLVHLLVSRVAPLQFWSIMLEDLLPLLQMCKENLLFLLRLPQLSHTVLKIYQILHSVLFSKVYVFCLAQLTSLLTASELYTLMGVVEDVDNERCIMNNSNLYVDQEKDSENYKPLLSDLRLALVKNLGRAIVARS